MDKNIRNNVLGLIGAAVIVISIIFLSVFAYLVLTVGLDEIAKCLGTSL